MTDREAFEAFITAPPFESSVSRFDDRGAWPGSYINYETDLAWKAWQAATAHERERCAKVCESLGMTTNGIYERNQECADAIRKGE